jgi:hypothetical protein
LTGKVTRTFSREFLRDHQYGFAMAAFMAGWCALAVFTNSFCTSDACKNPQSDEQYDACTIDVDEGP